MSALGLISFALALAAAAPNEPSAEDRDEARRLKNEAFSKIAEGSYADGVELLEAAFRAVPHPTFLFNIAVVYDQWPGHCSESLAAFDRFFEACDDCKVRPTAEKRFARVKDRCEVKLSITSVPTGSRATIDGEREGETPFEAELRPGRHRLRVEREGFEPHAEDVLLEPGRDQSVSIRLVPKATEPPPGLTTAAPGPSRKADRLRTWGWISMGIGAVGAGLGVVQMVRALDTASEADELANAAVPDASEVNDARSEARAQGNLMWVGYGVGAAGIGTGILLHVLAGQQAESERQVTFGTDGRGLVLSGRF